MLDRTSNFVQCAGKNTQWDMHLTHRHIIKKKKNLIWTNQGCQKRQNPCLPSSTVSLWVNSCCGSSHVKSRGKVSPKFECSFKTSHKSGSSGFDSESQCHEHPGCGLGASFIISLLINKVLWPLRASRNSARPEVLANIFKNETKQNKRYWWVDTYPVIHVVEANSRWKFFFSGLRLGKVTSTGCFESLALIYMLLWNTAIS